MSLFVIAVIYQDSRQSRAGWINLYLRVTNMRKVKWLSIAFHFIKQPQLVQDSRPIGHDANGEPDLKSDIVFLENNIVNANTVETVCKSQPRRE